MNKLIIGSLSLLLLLGCKGNDDTEIPMDDSEGVEIKFGSQVSSSLLSPSVNSSSTRGVFENGSGLPVGHNVGVYGIPAKVGEDASYTLEKFVNEEDFQEYLYNACYNITSTTNTKSEMAQPYVAKFPARKTEKNALSLYAYYPYTTEVSVGQSVNGFSIPIQLNQDDLANSTDYLYTGQMVAPIQKEPVELPLKHALARLDFKLYTTDTWFLDHDTELESIEINANRLPTGTMDIRDGKIHSNGNTLTKYTYKTPGKKVEFIFETEVEANLPSLYPVAKCLLLPFSGSIFTIVCHFKEEDGRKKAYTVYNRSIQGTPAISLEKGKITTINLLYLPRDVDFSANVVLWDKGDTYNLIFKEP